MAELLARLIPLGLAGAVSPVATVACIALLGSRRPVANASAYVAGITTVLAGVAAVALAVFGAGSASNAESSGVVNGIELALGALLVALGLQQALGRREPDAPPPRWFNLLERLGPARAYAFGVAIEATNIKRLAIFLAGLSEVARAKISTAQAAIAIAVFVALLELGLLAPIVIYAALPSRAETILMRARRWLLRHNRRILAVIFTAVGAVLVERGLSGLL